MRRIWIGCLISLCVDAQCVVVSGSGTKINANRPSENDTPAARVSPLAEFNGNLPSWICFSAGYRARLEDSYLLTRFRLGMLLKPVPWLKVYSELQDARALKKAPPQLPPYQTTWDLRQAYLELGGFQEGRLALRVGRQDLTIGDGQIVGTSYWRNASRGFDAATLVSNWSWINASFIAASPVVTGANGLSHHRPGTNFYVANARLTKIVPHGVLEPFALWNGTETVGVHWSGTAGKHWDYDGEMARQFGRLGSDKLHAWEATGIGGFTFSVRRFKIRAFGEYDFASGDEDPSDGVRGTFDQRYSNVHDHLGLADQFGRQNLKALRGGARVWLRKNWVLAGAWGDYWLANPHDGYYNTSGSIIARDLTGRSGTRIAKEVDVQTTFRLDRNLEFGAGVAHVFAGEFLRNTGHGASFSYPYAMMTYNFY